MDPSQREEGIGHLKQAHTRKEIADWMPKDPQLKVFWQKDGGRLFPHEPQGLFDLPLFEPYSEQLKRSGFVTASSIAALPQETLAAFTVADVGTRQAMIEVAHLITTLALTDLSEISVDIVSYLVEHDHARESMLGDLSDTDRTKIAVDVTEVLLSVKGAPAQHVLNTLISDWLATFRDDRHNRERFRWFH